MDPVPASPVSSTSAFLLGIHNYKALDDVNLPEFVKEHQATLTFPEKVSYKRSERRARVRFLLLPELISRLRVSILTSM
jgi:hypothetical protein